ncbi:MAG: VPLPA-CTERM sorting domain-containing protein, partial [Pseudomonadota bacterium]
LRIDFTATGGGIPTDPATGTIVLEYDPGVQQSDAPVLSSSFNFAVDGPVVFEYITGPDVFFIGGNGDADTESPFTNDFTLSLNGDPLSASFFSLRNDEISSGEFTFEVESSVTVVPLPAPALLLIAGLGALAVAARRAA